MKEVKECTGCEHEVEECYNWQQRGLHSGLEFAYGHVFLFVIDPKTNKFIIPCLINFKND